MIEINNLSKFISGKHILKDINLKVNEGSIFGLIGPNGAGKTTIIKILTGIYQADMGEVKVNKQNVFENNEVKKIMGYVPDENNLFTHFKIKDVQNFYKLSYKSFEEERFDRLNKIFKLPENLNIKKFSKGMKTRLSIILSLSLMPKVLVLDEPTSGLDPIIKKQFINILLQDVAERGTTVFISSHNLGELERICDSVAMISNGEIKYSNSMEGMKNSIKRIQVVFNGEAPSDLNSWDEVVKVEKIGRVYNIITRNYSDKFKEKINAAGAAFQEEINLSLEDIFIYSLGGDVIYEEFI